jgi:hypothetical protein
MYTYLYLSHPSSHLLQGFINDVFTISKWYLNPFENLPFVDENLPINATFKGKHVLISDLS